MADEIPLEAKLECPNTSGEHIRSTEMSHQLGLFRDQIIEMIYRLDHKEKTDVFELRFELDFFRNGIETIETTEGDHRKFRLRCYCNGGND